MKLKEMGFHGVYWIHLAVERDKGRIPGNSVMKLRVPYISEKLFPSSRKNLLQIVGYSVKCQRVMWSGEISITFWCPKFETDTTWTS